MKAKKASRKKSAKQPSKRQVAKKAIFRRIETIVKDKRLDEIAKLHAIAMRYLTHPFHWKSQYPSSAPFASTQEVSRYISHFNRFTSPQTSGDGTFHKLMRDWVSWNSGLVKEKKCNERIRKKRSRRVLKDSKKLISEYVKSKKPYAGIHLFTAYVRENYFKE